MLKDLPSPWGEMLSEFSQSPDNQRIRQKLTLEDSEATFDLYKADVSDPDNTDESTFGRVILVEDRTSVETLETELAHSERLASIGRLSAGVAHEIGNPLTGIASIAQNLHYEDNNAAVEESADDILAQVGRINSLSLIHI